MMYSWKAIKGHALLWLFQRVDVSEVFKPDKSGSYVLGAAMAVESASFRSAQKETSFSHA
jgi:hypothetical protein